MGSQELKKVWDLRESVPSPWSVMKLFYVYSLVFCGTLIMGTSMSLTVLSALETFPLLLDFLVHHSYEGFALCYCYLFCPVWLLSLRDLLLPEKEIGTGVC